MAIGLITALWLATTLTMRPVLCSQIELSTTPSIDNGNGSFATNHFSTGRSKISERLRDVSMTDSFPQRRPIWCFDSGLPYSQRRVLAKTVSIVLPRR